MAKGEARQHHYIPQCYLRGFSVKGKKHWQVTVANIKSGEFFETNTKNVGGERDFNRIEVPDHKTDALETAYSKFETSVAPAIRRVVESRKFEGDDRIAILNLMALLAVRGPHMREHWRQANENLMKRVMDVALATKERWEGQMRQMKEAGREVKEDITYDQIKDFHERGEYDVNMNREWFIALELKMFESVLMTLVNRKWVLYVVDPTVGVFVTCDRPVALYNKEPEKMPKMIRDSPGFGMRGTQILFPLTAQLALVGDFEDVEDGTQEAKLPLVAMANLRMIERAMSQVYTIKRTFPYVGPPFRIYHDSRFMERFAAAKKEKDAKASVAESQQSSS
jgi:hypothetical protein